MIYGPKEFILKDGRKVILKSPEISDAKKLLDDILIVSGQSNNLLSSPEDFLSYEDPLKREQDFIKGMLEGSNYLICVYYEGKIIGDCDITFGRHVKDIHRARIGIGIQEEFCSVGLGSIMMDELINLAKEKGMEQVELEVIANNIRAKGLYTKKGFVKYGDIPHQLKLKDGTYLDGESMVLFLK